MTSIFVDDSGSPVVDSQGNLLLCALEPEMKQRIVNVFSTPKISETLSPDYGFDLIAFLKAPPYTDKRLLLQSLAVEALNPRTIPAIKMVNNISCKIEDNYAVLDIDITGSDGRIYSDNYKIIGET